MFWQSYCYQQGNPVEISLISVDFGRFTFDNLNSPVALEGPSSTWGTP